MIIPNPPQSNQPVSADWGRGVIEALRRLRPNNGPGISVNQTPEGTTYSLASRKNNRFEITVTGATPCKITGGSSAAGYTVAFYADGSGSASTGTGTLYILEISGSADLPAGSWVLGWPGLTVMTGGNEPNV